MAAHRIEVADLLDQRRTATALDLSSRRRVLTDLSGTHISGFRGRGMEFEEHRAYVAGDEIRSIDWRVTARTGQTHVRSYREERERPVIIAVDVRAPMWFGSQGCFKAVLAARAAALIAWAACGNGDRVGGLRFGASHAESRPAGGRRGVLRLIQLLSEARAEPPGSAGLGLQDAVEELRQIARPGALVVVLSDFHDLDPAAQRGLRLLSRHCELIFGLVSDPLERHPPPPGLYPGKTRSTGPVLQFNTRPDAARQHWQAQFQAREQQAQQTAIACRAHWLTLQTDEALADGIGRSFGSRKR